MIAFPQPRYRTYGSARKYLGLLSDFAPRRPGHADPAQAFEAAVARFIGVQESVAMPQARVALYYVLRSILKDRREVVMSPYTIHDVVNMVISAGGKPVFADIERETWNVDAQAVERLVNDQTGAVLVTHLHGLACDIERIAQFCRARDVPLVEDCAQAFGARVAGKRVGSFGTVGIFSFGMAKNINSFFGGMLVTNDPTIAADARRQIANLPTFDAPLLMKRALFCLAGDCMTARPVFWSVGYWLFRLGYLHNIEFLNNQWRGEFDPELRSEIPASYLRRLSAMQARVALSQLNRVDRDTAARLRYARLYHEGLRDVTELALPPWREDGSHIYLTFSIQAVERDRLNRHLMQNYQDITVQHLTNTADQPCYAAWRRDCPNARAAAAQTLLLPTYPSYGERDVHRNVRLVRQFFGRQ
jgi:dTDP-4-amino-4,6-dideoxygalactose transaminase